MGQKMCSCVNGERFDDDRSVYGYRRSPFAQTSANSPSTVNSTDGKCKKRRFWTWNKGHKTDIREHRVRPTLDRSVSNSSDESFHTPALSLADLCMDVPRPPARSVSVQSDDSFHTPAGSCTDLLLSIPRPPVHFGSNLRTDLKPSLVQSGSNLGEDVPQPSVSPKKSPKKKFHFKKMRTLEVNSVKYKLGKKLGEGAYGIVFEGTRVKDGLKVAVKQVPKYIKDYITIPCHPDPLPREIALLILANKGSHVPEIIQLLDWQDNPSFYVLILEYPSPCEQLLDFFLRKNRNLTEALVRDCMWQATKAAYVSCQRGVFHHDIKPENILINSDTLDLKLIDFGCGDILKESGYKKYRGTPDYCCPEAFRKEVYYAEPTTVWSLGVMFYGLLCGTFPGKNTLSKMQMKQWSKDGLSKECCSLIQSCLQEDPNQRIRLKEMLSHQWFQIKISENSPQDLHISTSDS